MGKVLQVEINGELQDIGNIILSANGKTINISENPTIKDIQEDITYLQNNSGSGGGYTLPEASHDALGGIKIDGSTIIKNGDGTYSAVYPDITDAQHTAMMNEIFGEGNWKDE